MARTHVGLVAALALVLSLAATQTKALQSKNNCKCTSDCSSSLEVFGLKITKDKCLIDKSACGNCPHKHTEYVPLPSALPAASPNCARVFGPAARLKDAAARRQLPRVPTTVDHTPRHAMPLHARGRVVGRVCGLRWSAQPRAHPYRLSATGPCDLTPSGSRATGTGSRQRKFATMTAPRKR